MRKLVLIMVCLSLLLTGCWDYQEVDRLASVMAIGVDRIPESKSIILTVQIPSPEGKGSSKQTGGQGGGGGRGSFMVMNSESKSLAGAIRNLDTQLTRHISLAHCKVIVLGKTMAETGIGDILDELKRDGEFRRTDWLLTTNMTAKEIIEMDINLEQMPARGLDLILQNFTKEGRVLPMDVNDFLARLNEDSLVSYTPLVQLDDIDKQVTSKLEKAVGRPLDSEEKPKTVTICKTAVFKNLRMVGVLNEDDTRAHKWLVDSPKGSSIRFSYTPQSQTNEEKGEILLDIIDGKTTITPQITENGIAMNIAMTAEVALHETGSTGVKVLDPKVVEQLELQASEAMKLQLEHIVNTAQQELKSDCVGFAENLHNYNPVEWKLIKDSWDDTFATVDSQISCRVVILSTGIINSPTLRNAPEE